MKLDENLLLDKYFETILKEQNEPLEGFSNEQKEIFQLIKIRALCRGKL